MPAKKNVTKIVAYYRLSKPKKGKNKAETIRDAYGLEDQRREVARIAEEYGAIIIAEFQEIVTGTKKKPHREELEKAIAACRMHKAILVIGKQDRLARSVAFIANLMEAGIDFIAQIVLSNQSWRRISVRSLTRRRRIASRNARLAQWPWPRRRESSSVRLGQDIGKGVSTCEDTNKRRPQALWLARSELRNNTVTYFRSSAS